MRSRAVRLVCGAVAWIAIGFAAFYIVNSERQLAALRAGDRAFDLRAREVTDALADLRAAQQAYVAAGQGVAFWMPKVEQTTEAIGQSIGKLRVLATSGGARAAIEDTASALVAFREIDGRARGYLKSDQPLMAGDVIFTEGGQTVASAARQVEAARIAEHQALDALEGNTRKLEAMVLAGAGGGTALIVLLLGFAKTPDGATTSDRVLRLADTAPLDAPVERPQPPLPPVDVQPTPVAAESPSPILRAAAAICTDFAAVRDVGDLERLLARASDAMKAQGLVVWLGDAAGADLRPVLTHGYSEDARARLPRVPRAASNAAAAAYRSGEVQLVPSRAGGSRGAIVAPMLCADGCIGALSAEMTDGGEDSESVQALASIVAAQLASVLSASVAETPERRAAAAL